MLQKGTARKSERPKRNTHQRANMQTYSRKSIKLHEVPRERPTLRWRFVKCMCPTSHKRSRPGRVRDWQALQVRQAAMRKHLVISSLSMVKVRVWLCVLCVLCVFSLCASSLSVSLSSSVSLSGCALRARASGASVSPGASISSKVVSWEVKQRTL